MFKDISSADRTIAIQRLTALWALNECGLGGFLHAIQSPFTGLFVGSIAMICIALICSFSENKWQTVMTSLAIVLVIKALVSPHSAPTAYIAVVFQGVTGALMYSYIPGLFFSSIFFLSLGLLESALQRLLTLTILYGNTLWEAINIWGTWVTDKWGIVLPFSSSRLIIGFYLGIHLFVGIMIGWFIYKILIAIDKHWGESRFQLSLSKDEKKVFFNTGQKPKKSWGRYIFFVFLIVIIVFAYVGTGDKSDIQKGILAILRAVVILTLWFVFLAPFMIRLLQKWLTRKHQQLAKEVSATMDMFPQLLWIIDRSWKEARSQHNFSRLKTFILHSFLYILQYKSYHDPDPDRSHTKP